MRPSSPMAIWTPDSKRAPVQVRSASRIVHASSSQKCRTVRSSKPRAAANSSFGRNSFGLWATSIEPGPKMAQSIPSRCSQPASVAKETLAPALWPTRSQRWRWMGEASVEQHRRAVREQLDRRLEGGRGGAGGAAHPLDQLFRGDARQRPEPHFDHAAVGHDVDRRAAVDRADVERHVGDLREELAVGRRLRLQLPAESGERHDHPSGGLDGVGPEVGVAAVGGDAVEGHPQLGVPLVRPRHTERGGLADDRGARQALRRREAIDQPLRPQGADLLVVGEDEGQRRPPALGPRLGGEVGGQRQEPLHVAGAAPHPAVPLVRQGEGIVPPPLLVGGNDVHVPGEDEPPAVVLRVVRLGPQPGDDVGLACRRARGSWRSARRGGRDSRRGSPRSAGCCCGWSSRSRPGGRAARRRRGGLAIRAPIRAGARGGP